MTSKLEFPATAAVYVISLAEDIGRRTQLLIDLQRTGYIAPRLVTGLPGSTLCETARLALTDDGKLDGGKGTLGCFLSHVRVWELIAAGGEEFGVVLEDDTTILRFNDIADILIPGDAEIIFINERMCLNYADLGGAPGVRPISSLLENLDSTKSLGGDGYILTSRAAKKLITACTADLFYGHVDGRLLRYATSEQEIASLPDGSWIASVIRNHHNPRRPPQLGLLKGYCLSRPIVRHTAAQSTRELEDRGRGIATLRFNSCSNTNGVD